MVLNDFSSILEVLTGINLGYAGSETFRVAVNNSVYKLSNFETDRQKEQRETILAEAKAYGMQTTLTISLKLYEEKYAKELEILRQKELSARRFPNSLKSMFVMSSIYSTTLLVLAGYEEYFSENFRLSIIIYILNFIILYNLFVFFRSFIPKYFNSKIRPTYTIVLALFLIFTSVLYFKYCTWTLRFGYHLKCDESGCFIPGYAAVSIALLVCASPFMFHFLRLRYHKLKYRLLVKIINNQFSQKMDECQKSMRTLYAIDKWEMDSSLTGRVKHICIMLFKR